MTMLRPTADRVGQRGFSFVAVGLCLWLGPTLYPKQAQNENPPRNDDPPASVNFDPFAMDRFSVVLFDADGRTASVRSERIAQRKRQHHGFRFESYAELYADDLQVEFAPSRDGYQPKRVLSRLLRAESDSGDWISSDGDDSVASGDLAAAKRRRAKVTRIWAVPATISFLLRSGESVVVTAGDLQAHLAAKDLVRLSKGAHFRSGDDILISSVEAIWDICSNTFFVPDRDSTPTGEDERPFTRGPMACVPDADSGLVCSNTERYPQMSPDPLNLAASKIRAGIYQKLGLCESTFGKLLCGPG